MEQKEIKDAELDFSSPEPTEEDLAKKKKREAIFELVLFFILGVLLGVTVKTEAAKRITIGFNDYQIVATQPKQKYNVEEMKKVLDQQIAETQAAQAQAAETSQTQSNQ